MIDAATVGHPVRACGDSRRATTGCSRSSTSTRSSRAPTATPSGCTWTSGKARTGRRRPATSSAIRCRCSSTRRRPRRSARRRQGHSADRQVRRHRAGQAHQDSEQILTKWWGHPIYLGATVLLPQGLRQAPEREVPDRLSQGHFSTAAPAALRPRRGVPELLAWPTARRA